MNVACTEVWPLIDHPVADLFRRPAILWPLDYTPAHFRMADEFALPREPIGCHAALPACFAAGAESAIPPSDGCRFCNLAAHFSRFLLSSAAYSVPLFLEARNDAVHGGAT